MRRGYPPPCAAAKTAELVRTMSKRYVPKTYNNRRALRMLFGAVIFAAVACVVLFISLFFWLQIYQVPSADGGVRLEIPWLMDEADAMD